jgi:hypothetical protein
MKLKSLERIQNRLGQCKDLLEYLRPSSIERVSHALHALQNFLARMNQPRVRQRLTALQYQSMEQRKLLSAYFPAYVGGKLTLGDPDSSAPYRLKDTFKLETNPGASKTIYLDYNGHHSRNNIFGHNIVFPAFSRDGNSKVFNNAELIEIQKQFQNVAEDFAPFDVNVTTKDPGLERLTKTSGRDTTFGIRVVNTQATKGFGNTFGGKAHYNTFNDSIDNPVFVINKGANNGGITNSHEIGHALGLSHDGLYGNPYHPGVGQGETSWGPILGGPYRKNLSQWSNGNYAGASTSEDDIAIITRNSNGIDVKVDDHGNSLRSASTLGRTSATIFDWGFVERRSDVDYFRFRTATGDVNLEINAFGENPNLDVLAQLRDSTGRVIATSNPVNGVDASFSERLTAGTYYVTVEGVGKNGVYSDYGSLGFYTIEGSVAENIPITPLGETGRISNLYDAWKVVPFSRTYVNPVVVAGPASTNGGDPVTVRIRGVGRNSFQIRLDEWEYLDGNHGFESVDYMVVEAGTHRLSDGTIVVAGNTNGQTHAWKSYSFGDAFSTSNYEPVVLTQTTTINGNVAVANRLKDVTKAGFKLRLQEEQLAHQAHHAERVSWIAIEQGIGNASGLGFEAGTDSVNHENTRINYQRDFRGEPGFFAAIQTFDGTDTATVRYRNLSKDWARVFIEEEQSLNKELRHNHETVGYLAIPIGSIRGAALKGSAAALVAESGVSALQLLNPVEVYGPFRFDDLAPSQLLVNESSANAPVFNNVEDATTAYSRASMDHRGMLVDGDLSAAEAELASWADVVLPLGEAGDHHHEESEDDVPCCCHTCTTRRLQEHGGGILSDQETEAADWLDGIHTDLLEDLGANVDVPIDLLAGNILVDIDQAFIEIQSDRRWLVERTVDAR